MPQKEPRCIAGDVYEDAQSGMGQYKLSAVVCQYGAHFNALLFRPELGGWCSADDTAGGLVGDWPAVVNKMRLGKLQPTVLMYRKCT